MINGNMIGIGSAPLKTVIIEDVDGNQITGVVTGSEVIFTATDNDVREGLVYAGDEGVSTGTKVIPSYHTRRGIKAVKDGSELSITTLASNDNYDYTQLQIIVCAYNSTLSDSVAAEMVGIENYVYNVKTTEVLSTITKNHNDKSIDLNIVNNTGHTLIIRFFTYKEVE